MSWAKAGSRSRESRALRQRVLDRPARELRAATQPRLLADPRQAVLHRPRRDVELRPDLAIGPPVDEQPQDLLLAALEERADGRRLAARDLGVLLQQERRQRRAD